MRRLAPAVLFIAILALVDAGESFSKQRLVRKLPALERSPIASPTPTPTPPALDLPPEFSPGKRAESLSHELENLRKGAPGSERSMKEARLLYYLAQATEDIPARKQILIQGRDVAAEAKASHPEAPAPILWWVAHEASIADIDRGLSGLRAIKRVEEELLRLKKIDASFEYAAADRVLGRIYQKAPRFVSIGSSKKAEFHLRAALEKFPDFPGNQLFLAEFLLDEEEYAESLKLATMVLGNPRLKDFPWESPTWIVAAKRIADEAGAKLPKD